MASRGSETHRARWRRHLTAITLLLLCLLPLTDAAAGSPSPAPAPAPLRQWPPPRAPPQHAAPGGTKPRAGTPPPPPAHRSAHHPRRAAPLIKKSAWQRLNFGERFGIVLAGVAAAMQVALGAFLCVRARQLRRAAAAGSKDEVPQEQEPAASLTPA